MCVLVAILLVSGGAGGSGVRWHLCSGSAKRVADGLPFYTRRWMVWMASRMLMIMNRYNQTGGSNAFLRMFSRAGNDCGAGACGRGRGGGGMGRSGWMADADADRVALTGCLNGCRLRTAITGSTPEQNSRSYQVNPCMRSEA